MSAKKVKKKKLKVKEIRKKNKRIYLFLFLLGCACLTCTIVLYSMTIINAWLLVLISALSGFIGFLLDYKRYMFSYDIDGVFGYIGAYLHHVMFVGGVVGLLFLGSNYYLSNSITESKEYQIIERRAHKRSKSQIKEPIFTVFFDGQKKEFTFHPDYLDEMNEFRIISLKSVEGFWGYDVILDKKLNK